MTNRSQIGQAISWSAIDAFIRYGLNFFVLVVLARMLLPADFGLVAMLALFVNVSSVLIDGGFSQSLIQRQHTSPTDESSIFFFTLITGLLMALILCAFAPWIASFYVQPKLELMAYWMALNLFLNSFCTIHTTLLTKQLDFKTIAKVGAVSTIVSGCVAIYMALYGYGVWSLIGQALASTITTVFMLWLLNPWRPQWLFSIAALKSFFRFGGFTMWTNFVAALYVSLYALLIGKLQSVQEVGFYTQAQRLQQIPVNVMTSVISRVIFPVFAAAAEDKVLLARGLRKGMIMVMFINIPLMLGVMMLAKPLILTLFGAKWLSSVPIMQVLAAAGLLWPLHALNINVLNAQGYSHLFARIQLINLTIAITLLFITSAFGILAIAYGQVVLSFLVFFINAYYTDVFLGYSGLAQLRDILPYFVAAIPMIVTIYFLEWILEAPVQVELLISILGGSLIYLFICKIAQLEIFEFIADFLQKPSGRSRHTTPKI